MKCYGEGKRECSGEGKMEFHSEDERECHSQCQSRGQGGGEIKMSVNVEDKNEGGDGGRDGYQSRLHFSKDHNEK